MGMGLESSWGERMICIGDLVKVLELVGGPGDKMGIVVGHVCAWPEDDRDDTQLITVVHADGAESEWYDYNLDVVSEAGWPGA